MLLSLSNRFLGFSGARFLAPPLRRQVKPAPIRIVMRDRGKNRKPLQRGRSLSIEGIQAVQALKRAKSSDDELENVMRLKVRRLVKFDLMAVLQELQRQNEGLLALQIFEEVRREHWYKPRLLVYADMVRVLANSDLLLKMEILDSYLKAESFKEDSAGLNALLQTLLEFGLTHTAMDYYQMVKLWEIEPDESTFKIMVKGLANNEEFGLSEIVRNDAKEYFGGYIDFLEDDELECTDSLQGSSQQVLS